MQIDVEKELMIVLKLLIAFVLGHLLGLTRRGTAAVQESEPMQQFAWGLPCLLRLANI